MAAVASLAFDDDGDLENNATAVCLPAHACKYCGIHSPESVVRCNFPQVVCASIIIIIIIIIIINCINILLFLVYCINLLLFTMGVFY